MASDPTNTVSSSDGIHKVRDLFGRTTGPTRRSTKGQWTAEEDEMLRKAVEQYQGKNWKKIAECFKDRTDVQCLHRWQKVLNPQLVKGPWTKEEDDELLQLVEKYGPKKWSTIAQQLTGRIGKQCRERWHNHLNPAINKEAWTQEEELMLIHAHKVYGNKWAELTKFLPGRTDNAIKNHWNSAVKKKLDGYKASGLLEQFQGFPSTSHTNQSTPTTSSRTQQCSEDVAEIEEISECSQGSILVRCPQSNDDVARTMGVYTGEEEPPADMAETFTQPSDNLNHGNNNNPCELGDSSNFIEMQNPDPLDSMENNDFVIDMAGQMLDSEIHPPDGSPDLFFYEEPNDQIPNQDTFNYYSDLVETASFEFNGLSVGNEEFPEHAHDELIFTNHSDDPQFFNDQTDQIMDQSVDENGFQSNQSVDENGTQMNQSVDENGIQFNQSFGENGIQYNQSVNEHGYQINPSVGEFENHVLQSDRQEAGVLSYEPPRFPSTDRPFLSCDLIQSGGDLQDIYSPLGIRQLMSSMNNYSPCRIWDSPSHDGSPEGVSKSGAKNFTSTPSILKKRNRDFLSPLSEKKSQKKQERASFFNSPMFDENKNQQLASSSRTGDSGLFSEDKENMNPADEMTQKEGTNSTIVKEATADQLLASPNVSGRRNGSRFATSVPPEITVPNAPNDAIIEHSPMFGEKSSPFWSSFPLGPKLGTNITIEDIGYFSSPGERSYDAIELMSQFGEETGPAHANAREVLGDETPDSILKKILSEKGERSRQESHVLTERRVLDFSECVSPRKGDQSGRQSSGVVSFSSPSSNLLKGFR